MAVTSQRIQFAGANGAMLAARLERPAIGTGAYALFAHCFTCSKDIFAASRIATRLAAQGIATLRFDFTGLGASDGDFANTNFSSNVDDLVAAAAFLRTNYAAPQLLVGHSLGGAAVLAAAQHVPEAKAVATIGAPADPAHVAHLIADAVPEIESRGEAVVALAGRRFRIRKQFLDDIGTQRLQDAVGHMRKALLVLHAPRDTYVGIDNATTIFQAAKHPKSYVSLDDADHLLTRRRDADYVATILAAWASRYVDEAESRDTHDDQQDNAVVVSENGKGRFALDITAGRHLIHADEPQSYGGNDTGLTPYQLMSAALGACTAMTIRLYAARKKWPLDRVSVTVFHDKIHAQDCADCETRDGKVDRFMREISVQGELDRAQEASLSRIADRCPVHRTLHGEVAIESKLGRDTPPRSAT